MDQETRFIWVASPKYIMEPGRATAFKFQTKQKRFKFGQKISIDKNGYITRAGKPVGWILKNSEDFAPGEYFILTDRLREMLHQDLLKGGDLYISYQDLKW